jgi:hypothetical protein
MRHEPRRAIRHFEHPVQLMRGGGD